MIASFLFQESEYHKLCTKLNMFSPVSCSLPVSLLFLGAYNHWMTVTTEHGTYSNTTAVTGSPSVSADQIDSILAAAKSPAKGTGSSLYAYGTQYGINPAFALAVFKHESNYGTAGVATEMHSLGNLRCIPDAACQGGYAAFPTWQEGYSAFYKLISGPLYVGSGLVTPDQIMPKYAPAADRNDPTQYATAVDADMLVWRKN
jgi:hypothetical protein